MTEQADVGADPDGMLRRLMSAFTNELDGYEAGAADAKSSDRLKDLTALMKTFEMLQNLCARFAAQSDGPALTTGEARAELVDRVRRLVKPATSAAQS